MTKKGCINNSFVTWAKRRNIPVTYKTVVLVPYYDGYKNVLTQDMINEENIKYVIKHDYWLNGGTITVPENSILEFDGGILHDGTIIGQDTSISDIGGLGLEKLFAEDIVREGTWKTKGVQVQSDWNQTDSQLKDFIKNKPNLAEVATSGSYNDLKDKPTIPAEQIQSDWNETDVNKKSFIKNKPTIPEKVTIDAELSDTSENPVQNKVITKALDTDKSYDPTKHSGLGRKTLKLKGDSNVLTQDDFDQENTIYVITYDFDLGGAEIQMPAGCVLEFDGGHITGGTLTGTVLNESLNIDNFTLNEDATEALQNCVNICGTVVGSNKRYKVSRTININRALTLKGENLRLYSETPLNFFNVNSDNVTISGVEIKGVAEGYPDKDMTTARASYLLNVAEGKKDITIKDCVLDSATGGVFVYPDCDNITVTNCIMKNMVYIPNDVSAPFAAGAGGYGVCLHNQSGSMTKNVKINHNIFDNIHRHCAYVQVCKNVDFGYNQIINSILQGRFMCAVHQAGCDSLSVHDNYMYGGSNFVGLANYDTVQIPKAITNIYNNSLFGITMFAVAQLSTELQSGTIKGNYVELNNGCGFVYFGDGSQVEDYVISDNICNGNIVAQYYSLTKLGMVVFSVTKSINGVIISNNKFNIGDGSVAYCPCVNVSYNKSIASPTLKCIQIVNNQFTNKCPNGRGLLLGDLSVINSFFAANNIIDTTYQAVEIQAVTIGNAADVVIRSNYYKGAMTGKGTVTDNIAIPS